MCQGCVLAEVPDLRISPIGFFSNGDLQLTFECFTTGWESSRTRSELPVGKRMVHGLQVGGESRFKVVLVGVDKPAGHAGGIRNHLT